jgi:hypothetical protein
MATNKPEPDSRALTRWPRDVPDEDHIRAIMRETGLSEGQARLALDIGRGDSVGDVVDLGESSEPA